MAAPDFDHLCDVLSRHRALDTHPAELHGLACGFLAAGFPLSPVQWLEQVEEYVNEPGLLIDEEATGLLAHLMEESRRQLEEGDFEFQPCLPDDDLHDMAVRSESLARWCQGFLHGFAPVQAGLNDGARELLGDLAEISRLEMESGDESNPVSTVDENEGYYTELVEFVRMAVISLFMDYSESFKRRSAEPHGHH